MVESGPVIDNMTPILIDDGELAAAGEVAGAVVVCGGWDDVVGGADVVAGTDELGEGAEEQLIRTRLRINKMPRRVPKTFFTELPPSKLFSLLTTISRQQLGKVNSKARSYFILHMILDFQLLINYDCSTMIGKLSVFVK